MSALDQHAALRAAKVGPGRAPCQGLGPPASQGVGQNCRLQPAGGWMPQAAWEAMLADALHPLGVNPCNLPAPEDHPYVLRRLRETLQETQRDGIRQLIRAPRRVTSS